MTQRNPITTDMIDSFSNDFASTPSHHLFSHAIQKSGINDVSLNQHSLVNMNYTFSTEIDTGKITAQHASGRCWLFAGTNVLRKHIADKIHVKDFELSQSYLFFWDKLEKANFFYENILETLESDIYDRAVMFLLQDPLGDGGQWDMFVNLVNKYGLMPKHCMPETFHSKQSRYMVWLLTMKLRKDAHTLRSAFSKGSNLNELQILKKQLLNEFYRMLCHFLGEPPKQFDFEYREDEDKHKTKFHRYEQVTPIQFRDTYVDMILDDYVSIINAPTDDKPFNKTYTVQYLGNVAEGNMVIDF